MLRHLVVKIIFVEISDVIFKGAGGINQKIFPLVWNGAECIVLFT